MKCTSQVMMIHHSFGKSHLGRFIKFQYLEITPFSNTIVIISAEESYAKSYFGSLVYLWQTSLSSDESDCAFEITG